MAKFWLNYLKNRIEKLNQRRKDMNERANGKLLKIRVALGKADERRKLWNRFLNWRADKVTERRTYLNARTDEKIAYLRRKLAILDDDNWVKNAQMAARKASKVIEYYDDAIFTERSGYAFGGSSMFGMSCQVLVLAIIEMAMIIGVLCFLGLVVGINLSNGWILLSAIILCFAAICVPLDILYTKGILFNPFLRLKIWRLRILRDSMNEISA